MARKPDTDLVTTKTPPQAPVVEAARTNEFSGMSADARHELAVARIRGQWLVAGSSLTSIGQTLIDACHDGDETAALSDDADDDLLFKRIVTSLGTIKGGPSERMLSAMRRVAAASTKVPGRHFDLLPFGHKEIIIRLKEMKLMGAVSKRVVEFGLTRKQTEEAVAAELAAAGTPKRKRGQKLSATRGRLRDLAQVAEPESLDRLGAEYEKLQAPAKKKVREELDKALAALAKLRRRLG